MKVLLSIKPKYVEEIKKGNKRYEFRKTRFNRKCIKEVYIYSTTPVKQIIGSFKIKKIIEDHPQNLWRNFKEFSGISENEFFDYYNNKDKGIAIEINEFELFEDPIDPYLVIPNFVAPQSFRYFEQEELEHHMENCLTLDNFVSK